LWHGAFVHDAHACISRHRRQDASITDSELMRWMS